MSQSQVRESREKTGVSLIVPDELGSQSLLLATPNGEVSPLAPFGIKQPHEIKAGQNYYPYTLGKALKWILGTNENTLFSEKPMRVRAANIVLGQPNADRKIKQYWFGTVLLSGRPMRGEDKRKGVSKEEAQALGPDSPFGALRVTVLGWLDEALAEGVELRATFGREVFLPMVSETEIGSWCTPMEGRNFVRDNKRLREDYVPGEVCGALWMHPYPDLSSYISKPVLVGVNKDRLLVCINPDLAFANRSFVPTQLQVENQVPFDLPNSDAKVFVTREQAPDEQLILRFRGKDMFVRAPGFGKPFASTVRCECGKSRNHWFNFVAYGDGGGRGRQMSDSVGFDAGTPTEAPAASSAAPVDDSVSADQLLSEGGSSSTSTEVTEGATQTA